jgi:hypothetical protein
MDRTTGRMLGHRTCSIINRAATGTAVFNTDGQCALRFADAVDSAAAALAPAASAALQPLRALSAVNLRGCALDEVVPELLFQRPQRTPLDKAGWVMWR